MEKERDNQEWIQDLTASSPIQAAAINDLRELLLRAALYFFSRNQGDVIGLGREEILQRAEDCAQDALLAVMDHLQDFRGDSKFSTWAYKFAINKSLMASRHERWKDVRIDQFSLVDENNFVDKLMHDSPNTIGPEQTALQSEALKIIRDVVAHELTEKQRDVLVLIVIQDVPLDEVARHLNTNRNAVYKMLHDARLKLKKALLFKGFDVIEMLNLFSVMK